MDRETIEKSLIEGSNRIAVVQAGNTVQYDVYIYREDDVWEWAATARSQAIALLAAHGMKQTFSDF